MNLKTLSKNGAPKTLLTRHQSRIMSPAILNRKPVHKISTSVSKFPMFRECFVIRSFLVKILYNIFFLLQQMQCEDKCIKVEI